MPLLKIPARFWRSALHYTHKLYFGVVASAVFLALAAVAGSGFLAQLQPQHLTADALSGSIGVGPLNLNLGGLFGSGGSGGASGFGSAFGVSFGGSTDTGGAPAVQAGSGSTNAPGCGNTTNCLLVPDGKAYSGIGLEGSLRQAILNWVNFFLGFLALLSMIIIIYAGFLYITAAGDEDQAGTAKKAIMYTLIGIIIIFLAFALVNTFITKGAKGGDLVSDILSIQS